jgi:hypothetical protein
MSRRERRTGPPAVTAEPRDGEIARVLPRMLPAHARSPPILCSCHPRSGLVWSACLIRSTAGAHLAPTCLPRSENARGHLLLSSGILDANPYVSHWSDGGPTAAALVGPCMRSLLHGLHGLHGACTPAAWPTHAHPCSPSTPLGCPCSVPGSQLLCCNDGKRFVAASAESVEVYNSTGTQKVG